MAATLLPKPLTSCCYKKMHSTALELLKKRDIVLKYLSQAKSPLSVFSFTSLFTWKDYFKFDLKIINDCLCVFAYSDLGCFLYLPPLGNKIDERTIDKCFAVMEKTNGKKGITRIENVSEDLLKYFPEQKYALYKKGYEYCYFRDDIVALKGNAYKSKRSSLNQFLKNYKHEFCHFDSAMIKDCVKLYDQWAANRLANDKESIYRQMIEDNRNVHQLAIKYYNELGLVGRVVRVNGETKAYTFGYAVNKETFCILFEITDLNIKGLAVYIFREMCADPKVKNYRFINVMDDFELKNIEATKMSFNPSLLLPMYVVTRKKVQ